MTTPNFGGLLFEHHARELASNFREFAEAAWPVLEPTTPLVPGRHLDIIGEYLSAVSAGQIRKLIVNIPPRMTKSTLATILWPCWMWAGDEATSRWMFASYSASLSLKHSVDRRTLLTSDWFTKLWPQVQLAEDQNEKSQYASTNRGHMLATSINATATGKGGGILVIDDPHSVQQAMSDVERANAVRYCRTTLMTRLDDPRTGCIVVIMQRLHEADLTGELLRDGGWEHLCLPAIAESRQVISLPISGGQVIREVGDLLEPARLSQRTLDDLKISMGSFAFAGQLQQTPAPTEGGLFKRSWWRRYTIVPATATFLVQSWDLAFKDKLDSDFVVGQVWAFDGQLAYLLDQVRQRMGYVETKQAMRDMHRKWPATSAILIEDKANGSAVIDELRRELPGVIAIEPEGGKISRAWACTAQVEAGQVYLPEAAAWCEDFLLECSVFPAGSHDDSVDAMTQALNWRRQHGFGGVYSKALSVSSSGNNSVVYDAAAHPEWSHEAWYGSRTICVIPGTSKPGCILEVLSRGCYEPYYVTRELLFNDAAGNLSLTADEIWQELMRFTHKQNMGSGRMEFDSNIYMPEAETELRNECWRKGFVVQTIDIEDDEVLGIVQRVGTMFDRRKVRVSSECRHFIQQHREFRYDIQKASKTGVETLIEDGRHPAVDAFRLFVSKINFWSL